MRTCRYDLHDDAYIKYASIPIHTDTKINAYTIKQNIYLVAMVTGDVATEGKAADGETAPVIPARRESAHLRPRAQEGRGQGQYCIVSCLSRSVLY